MKIHRVSPASSDTPERSETANPFKRASAFFKAMIIWAIAWLPIVLSLLAVIQGVNHYHYPIFDPVWIAVTMVSLLPSMAVLTLSKTKLKFRNKLRHILLVCCVLSIPVSFITSLGIVSRSETTDFRNYRELDADCLANRDKVFQELFPVWPHYFETAKQADGGYETVYLEAEYYYQYRSYWDYTYDICAQWPLDETEYHKEVARATDLLHNAAESSGGQFVEMKKGSYQCLILYSGDEPFTPATDSYDYILFAHDGERKVVRYICCCSLENGADQPYYLSLDW